MNYIMVIDDSPTIRTSVQSVIGDMGYPIEQAENGVDALNILGQQNFDLVVTDILMPKMDGFTLTKEIRSSERSRNIPVVIVTSMESETDKMRGLEVGANAYLIKSSFDQKHLIETIETLLGQRGRE